MRCSNEYQARTAADDIACGRVVAGMMCKVREQYSPAIAPEAKVYAKGRAGHQPLSLSVSRNSTSSLLMWPSDAPSSRLAD